jgi:Raf kinase inhibitor-like YbhB/YbcL family protein
VLSITSSSFAEGERVPEANAFGVAAEEGHAAPGGGNRSPQLSWSGVPEGTRSFVLTVFDPDVPADASDVNQEGKTLPLDSERTDFAHWIVVDIPASVTELPEGAGSDGIVLKGKPTGETSFGGVTGANDYTSFLAGDPDMGGTYGNYDGPFPPWNDERLHHYVFRIHALDVESTGLSGDFGLADVREAIDGHVLEQAELTGTYAINPDATPA